jgi:hypothetical protein
MRHIRNHLFYFDLIAESILRFKGRHQCLQSLVENSKLIKFDIDVKLVVSVACGTRLCDLMLLVGLRLRLDWHFNQPCH